MRVVVASDIHSAGRFVQVLASRVRDAELILVLGDITHFGDAGEAASILAPLRRTGLPLFGVSGNCDKPEVERMLLEQGISLHGRCVVQSGYAFLGMGGSLPAPVATPNELSEPQIELTLERAAAAAPPDAPLVLVCHQPPKDTELDVVYAGRHVGSRAVREFLLRHSPVICFSGHLHEARGTDELAGTFLVNPGPLREGCYARVDLDGQRVDTELLRLS